MTRSAITRRSLMLFVVVSMCATPAFADLKLVQTVTTKAFGPAGGTSTSTTYIKGMKMRIDTVSGNTTRTMIFDVEAQKIYVFDSKKKEVAVWDMADFGKTVGTTVAPADMKATLTPTGKTKDIAGKTATGYEMNISMPTQMGDAKSGMQMTVNLTGPLWVVKGAPGTADFLRFYKAAAERGWLLGDPNGAKRSAGQARAMVEMYRQLVSTGGVPYETEMNIKMDMGGGGGGDNPMAGMMARMGGISSTSTVQSADVSPLADDLFGPPAGYKLNQQK
jgi:hypothetical protein